MLLFWERKPKKKKLSTFFQIWNKLFKTKIQVFNTIQQTNLLKPDNEQTGPLLMAFYVL